MKTPDIIERKINRLPIGYVFTYEDFYLPVEKVNVLTKTLDHEHAYQWSRTRMGCWAVAQSPILVTTITLERLAKRGNEVMLDLYIKIAPHLNDPLYAMPACTVV